MSGTTSTGTFAATGAYYVTNGQIVDPAGRLFVAAGIGVMEGSQPAASTLLNDFPGINFVRLAIYDYASPATLSAYVEQLTSAGIVVELEDHTSSDGTDAGGESGTIFSGQHLATELNWYSSVAAAFANNPYVWFGTDNEPSEIDPAGNQDPAALSAWQQQTYNAVRDTGNASPILIEINGGTSPSSFAQGYAAADYAGMTNIVGDVHYYGWVAGYSTDQGTVSGNLAADIAQTQQTITSANGVLPIIIGEYGNSTSGTGIDPNANQVITAVQQSGYGSAAWAWGQGNPGDGLTAGDGISLSAYGQQIAAGIAAAAYADPVSPAVPAAPPAVTVSGNDTTVLAGTGESLTDASGNSWTIVNGVAQINGQAAAYSANVTELSYMNGVVWQENSANLWWQWTGAGWEPASGIPASPLQGVTNASPSANDTTVLAGSGGAIVDGSGNTWTITGTDQVAVNGTTDPITANVTELAFVNNVVWQETSAGLWWSETSPGAGWGPVGGTGTSPLPQPIPVVAGPISQGPESMASASGNQMQFISGSGETVTLPGGTSTITDTGHGNTYILPAAGADTFAGDILAAGDTLDLTAALAATGWNGSVSTLPDYLSVADTATGAVLSIAPAAGAQGVMVATIDGATTATLSSMLAHLTT